MSNIQQKVYIALAAIGVAGGAWPNTLPEKPTYPAIVYQFVSNPPADSFSHGARFTDFHPQVTLHCLDYAGLVALRAAVLLAFEAMAETIVRELDIESPFAFETKTYTHILGFHLRDSEQ